MTDWIFCNKCTLKLQGAGKFFIAECGHIFCEKCVDHLKQTKTCNFCSKPLKVIELSKDMDPSLQPFFLPIQDLGQQFLQVVNFQMQHKNMYLQSLNKKYSFAKKECIRYYNVNKKLQLEIKLLRDRMESLGHNPELHTSTPTLAKDFSYRNNHSSTMFRSPYTPKIGSVPGSARRIMSDKIGMQCLGNPACSPIKGPSPAQRVPQGYAATVHRNVNRSNPAAAPAGYMEILRRNAVNPGHPRK